MSLFKKASTKPAPEPAPSQSVAYPFETTTWNAHRNAIRELIKSAGIDLNELSVNEYLKCKIVPEPTNPSDPNALKVSAAPSGRGKDYFDIGYVPKEYIPLVRTDMKKVQDGSHYWSIKLLFDVFRGISFSISLKESKFNR